MYGRNLNLPYSLFSETPQFNYNDAPSYCELLIPTLQNVYSQVHNNLVKVAEAQEKYREKTAVVKNIKVGDSVWLFTPAVKKNQSKKLAKLNTGIFNVVKKINDVNYVIAKENNLSQTQTVHVDRLTLVKNRLKFPEPPSPVAKKVNIGERETTAADENRTREASPASISIQTIPTPQQSFNRFSTLRRRRKFCGFPIWTASLHQAQGREERSVSVPGVTSESSGVDTPLSEVSPDVELEQQVTAEGETHDASPSESVVTDSGENSTNDISVTFDSAKTESVSNRPVKRKSRIPKLSPQVKYSLRRTTKVNYAE